MRTEVLTAEIGAAPAGPEVGAFFDFDGTLIAGYSARAFFEDRLRRGDVSPGELAQGVLPAEAVRGFAKDQDVDLGASFGYANGDEDVAFLEAVGRPRPLNPGPHLARVAAERGWPVRQLKRRSGFGLEPLLRTGAALVGVGAVVGLAGGVGLVNRSRRDAANLAPRWAPRWR